MITVESLSSIPSAPPSLSVMAVYVFVPIVTVEPSLTKSFKSLSTASPVSPAFPVKSDFFILFPAESNTFVAST